MCCSLCVEWRALLLWWREDGAKPSAYLELVSEAGAVERGVTHPARKCETLLVMIIANQQNLKFPDIALLGWWAGEMTVRFELVVSRGDWNGVLSVFAVVTEEACKPFFSSRNLKISYYYVRSVDVRRHGEWTRPRVCDRSLFCTGSSRGGSQAPLIRKLRFFLQQMLSRCP